jgi:hypothetical protein
MPPYIPVNPLRFTPERGTTPDSNDGESLAAHVIPLRRQRTARNPMSSTRGVR